MDHLPIQQPIQRMDTTVVAKVVKARLLLDLYGIYLEAKVVREFQERLQRVMQ